MAAPMTAVTKTSEALVWLAFSLKSVGSVLLIGLASLFWSFTIAPRANDIAHQISGGVIGYHPRVRMKPWKL
jgi:hypothetical protein